MTTTRLPDIAARRAVEALRSGVPSREAVTALGTWQTDIEDRVVALLDRVCTGAGFDTHRERGLLLGGGFGSGKSHLLEHLAHLVLDSGWVVSRVVISKETPLYDPAKVFRSAVETATSPGALPGEAVTDAATSLDGESRAYAELFRWACSAASGLDPRFPATLALYLRARERDDEAAEAIVRFWSGDPLKVSDLRRWLREAGEPRQELRAVPVRELAAQRIRFLPRLLAAAGRAGWLVLLDEVELIGRYGLMSRARSYAEVEFWMRGRREDAEVPLACVLAMTDDFEAAVLSGKDDLGLVPTRLRAKQTPDADSLVGRAEAGMRLIERSMVALTPPDEAELTRTYQRLKQLHGEAFGWSPPDVAGLERLAATRMRQYVRAWINEWDLVRLDPGYRPASVAVRVEAGYREDDDLGDGQPA